MAARRETPASYNSFTLKCTALRLKTSRDRIPRFFRDRTLNSKLFYSVSMHLFINGQEKTFSEPLRLSQLIAQLGMKDDRVAVELNREIVTRTQWSETKLTDGDRLEIVHFVGGG